MSNLPNNPSVNPEVAEKLKIANAGTQAPAPQPTTARDLSAVNAEALEAAVRKVLAERNPQKPAPVEPDWASLTEFTALDPDAPVYIPVIEHEVPNYLDMELADPEYIPVWANKNEVRVSQLVAEGYELLKAEHVRKGFKLPLKFGGEGFYIYADVICMRVHKRILFGKRRRLVELSTNAMKALQAKERVRQKLEQDVIGKDPALGDAFARGEMSIF